MPSISISLTRAVLRFHPRVARGVFRNQYKAFSTTPPTPASSESSATETKPPASSSSPGSGHEKPGSEPGPGKSSSSGARGPITYFSLALTGLVGAGIVAYYSIEREKRAERVTNKEVVSTGKPALGGPWSLVDSDGVPRTSAQFHGRFSLLYFGFTHCPDICPSELVKVGKIVDALGKLCLYDNLLFLLVLF